MDATGLLKSDTCMHALTALYSTREEQSKHTLFPRWGILHRNPLSAEGLSHGLLLQPVRPAKAPAASSSNNGSLQNGCRPQVLSISLLQKTLRD